jgi:hypothetical protein
MESIGIIVTTGIFFAHILPRLPERRIVEQRLPRIPAILKKLYETIVRDHCRILFANVFGA